MGFNRDTSKKVALITGGAIRIGRALAQECANHGYRLIIHYNRSAAPAEAFSAELTQQGVDHCLLPCDLSDGDAVDQLFEQIPEAFQSVDLLVNSAAVFPEQDTLEALHKHWSDVMAINAYAPVSLAKQFAAQFSGSTNAEATKSGSERQIVNVVDSRLVRAEAEHFVYRMAKQALKFATYDMAVSLAPAVRVNAIAPGAILPPPGAGDEHLERLAQSIPLRKTGDLQQIRNALDYFLRQPFVTGQVLKVDGGEFL